MKYVLSLFGVGLICMAIFLFGGQKGETVAQDSVRIHVVANSNSSKDEEIKYFVKDVVVEFLREELASVKSSDDAQNYIILNLFKIQNLVDAALKEQGVTYSAKISLMKEDMPLRAYDGVVFEAGLYDSLKIELGQARGDNWWCVVFPSVCFISSKNLENFEYKSKIWEIITSVT